MISRPCAWLEDTEMRACLQSAGLCLAHRRLLNEDLLLKGTTSLILKPAFSNTLYLLLGNLHFWLPKQLQS